MEEVLREPTCCQKINPIKPPIGVLKRNHAFYSIYIVAYLIRYLPFYIFALPKIHYWAAIVTIVIGVLAISSFFIVSNMSPGYVEPKPYYDLQYLYNKYDEEFV